MTSLADIQRRVGVAADGRWGPETAAAIAAAIGGREPGSPIHDQTTRLALEHLTREEGRIPHAYQDHLSFWTIGVGRLIDRRKGGRLTDAEIDLLLANDVARVRRQLATDPDTAAAWAKVEQEPVRAVALISMAFQMGAGAPGRDNAGLSGFDNTLGHIAAGRWDAAAAGMMASLWAKQTPERARRVAAMIRSGKIA